MCLNTLWSEEQKNAWLKEQSEMITAYKFVAVRRESIKRYEDGEEKISPPFKMLDEDVHYKKKNIVKKTTKISKKDYVISHDETTTYVAYFHLFLEKKATEKWNFTFKTRTLECKIPKKLITDIGEECGEIVIITRGFDFVEGDEYF